jgi:dihydroxy-acid dehydratase
MAACEGCTCGRANTVKGTSEAEAWTEVNGSSNAPSHGYERREPKSFTAPHDWVEPTGGVEPAVPLRSKLWFNNPGDGVSGCPQHGRQC